MLWTRIALHWLLIFFLPAIRQIEKGRQIIARAAIDGINQLHTGLHPIMKYAHGIPVFLILLITFHWIVLCCLQGQEGIRFSEKGVLLLPPHLDIPPKNSMLWSMIDDGEDKRAKELRRTSDYSRHETPQLPDRAFFNESSVSHIPYSMSLFLCKSKAIYRNMQIFKFFFLFLTHGLKTT